MSSIVCATRGGEGSRAVQIAAIRRARAEEKPLIFLYVTDPATLGDFDETLLPAVREELNWMGKTLLNIARHRAELANLKADVAIRMGNVQEEISRFLQERDASVLMLGAPRSSTANVFGDSAIEGFALSIEEKTGIPVEIVRPESVRE
ncbi:MAG TPA: universal stress protein [Anaerolineae bacterium]